LQCDKGLQSRMQDYSPYLIEGITCRKPGGPESWAGAWGLGLLDTRTPSSRLSGTPPAGSIHRRYSSGKAVIGALSMDKVGLEGSRRSSSSSAIPRPTAAGGGPPPTPDSKHCRIGLECVLQGGVPRARSPAMDPEPKVLSTGELARLILDVALGEATPAYAAQQGDESNDHQYLYAAGRRMNLPYLGSIGSQSMMPIRAITSIWWKVFSVLLCNECHFLEK